MSAKYQVKYGWYIGKEAHSTLLMTLNLNTFPQTLRVVFVFSTHWIEFVKLNYMRRYIQGNVHCASIYCIKRVRVLTRCVRIENANAFQKRLK